MVIGKLNHDSDSDQREDYLESNELIQLPCSL